MQGKNGEISAARARTEYIAAVCIYGSISILIRYADFPSEGLAFYRAVLGSLFIFLYQRIRGERQDRGAVRENMKWLILSGMSLGLNWIFLFGAYVKIPISIASLINYTAPVITVAIAPLVLREKLDIRKIPFIFMSFAGVVLVSGVLEGGAPAAAGSAGDSVLGLIYAALASLTFVGILVFSRKMTYVPPLDRVFWQLVSAAAVIGAYLLITTGSIPVPRDPEILLVVIVLGSVYTALANILYFAGIIGLPVQAVAVLGYLESATAIIVSLVVFHEPMSLLAWAGAVLIIASAVMSEIMPPPKEPGMKPDEPEKKPEEPGMAHERPEMLPEEPEKDDTGHGA